MNLSSDQIRWILIDVFVLVISVALHEFGHAYMATRMGDDTPRRQGRVTLNPLAHIDPIGTLLLPIAGGIYGAAGGRGGGFGWGKPVQWNPSKVKRGVSMAKASILVAISGPLMNLLLGTLTCFVHVLLIAKGGLDAGGDVSKILNFAVMTNFVLFFFNLVPCPPLDGGHVLEHLMPYRYRNQYASLAKYGPFVILAIAMIPQLAQIFLIPAQFCADKVYVLFLTAFGLILMDNGYQVELDVFEGPLDLLLHLVKKHELSILEIPISFVTEKYLAYLDQMQSLDIDVAAEYLVMAATLCHIKSRELLPNPEPLEPEETEDGKVAEEEIDPRADLIKRLLEYQKYKEAADQLGGRPVVGRNVWHRGVAIEDAVGEGIDLDAIAPLLPFPVVKLIEAFDRVMRSAKVARVSHDVTIDQLSISQKIAELTDRLEAEGRFPFTSMFSFLKDGVVRTLKEIRHEAVVTFLALLEMAKLRLLSLQQLPDDEEIIIERVGDDLRARVAHGVARTDDYRS